jgi:hypothetical protein
MTPGELMFIFVVAPICVVLAVRWFVGLRHVNGGLFSDDNVGDTVEGGLLALGGFGVGALALVLFRADQRSGVIESACPVCGAHGQRCFMEATNRQERPTPCGACPGYLRVSLATREVREESLDASDEKQLRFELRSEQYEPVVPRGDDEDHQFQFKMPSMCAVCGAPDAPLLRDIGESGRTLSTTSIGEQLTYRAYASGRSTTASPGELRDAALRHLKTPVCSQHPQRGFFGDALAYQHGTLRFASYGFYKAFCELNHITAGLEATASGPPEAKIHVTGQR